MDGPEGEEHVRLGAEILGALFGTDWYMFSLLHSRYYAKKLDVPHSRLAVADKMAIALTPWWLYLPMVRATGEIREYQTAAKHIEEHGDWKASTWREDRAWFRSLQKSMAEWAIENKERHSRIYNKSSYHQGSPI